MALISNPSDPNKKNTPDQPGMQPTIQQRRGTGFTNLSRILEANKQNKLGQAVGGGVAQQAQGAKQTISGAQQEFGKQAESVREGLQQAQQFAGQTLQNVAQPGQEANVSDEEAKRFAMIRAGQYTGPTELSNADAVRRQSQEATQLGQLTGSSGGREYLLQRFAANPSTAYGSGARRLDMALLGKQGGQDLKTARRASVGLENQANEALNLAREQGQTLKSATTGLAEDVTKQIGEQRDPLLQQLAERKAAEESKFLADKARIEDALARGQISAADAERLGLSDISDLYDVNLSNYVNSSITPATELGVASREEAARANALAKLAGKDQLGDLGKAGGFLQNQFTTDKGNLQNQIANRKAAYNTEVQKITNDPNYQSFSKKREETNNFSSKMGELMGTLNEGKVAAQRGDTATARRAMQEYMSNLSSMQNNMPEEVRQAMMADPNSAMSMNALNLIDPYGAVRWNEAVQVLDRMAKTSDAVRNTMDERLQPYKSTLKQIDSAYNAGRKLSIT